MAPPRGLQPFLGPPPLALLGSADASQLRACLDDVGLDVQLVEAQAFPRLPRLVLSLRQLTRRLHLRLILALDPTSILAALLVRAFEPATQIIARLEADTQNPLQRCALQRCDHILVSTPQQHQSLLESGLAPARSSILPPASPDAQAHLRQLLQNHLPP